MQVMFVEVVVVAFTLGGVLGAAMALHLKAATESKSLNSKGRK